MSTSNFAWDSTGDVLQGITGSPMASTPSKAEPSSDLSLGDPASFLGLQFGTDPGILPQAHSHASLLSHLLPSRKQPSSPSPQHLDYPHYPPARFMNNQDAWTPLQVTGVSHNPAAFAMRPVWGAYQMGGLDRSYSTGQYSTPSESESQCNGLHSSDSGYSTRSCTTRSIAASYAVDSACSPYLAPHDYEQDDKVSAFDIGSTHCSETMEVVERPDSPALLCPDVIKCDYPSCRWTGKCPSDKRKHEARHKKQFKCDEPNCTRKEGFGTINDLARHKKCVHKKEPERGPKVLYMCFGDNCPRRNKKWPRLDNFRQHLARMHNDEDGDELLRKSREWYEECLKSQDVTPSSVDRFSEDLMGPQTQQQVPEPDPHQELCSRIVECHTVFPSSEMLTRDPIHKLERHEDLKVDHVPTQSMDLPTFKSLHLGTMLEHKPSSPSESSNPKHDKMDDMIAEAATRVINAMMKMINVHQRRRTYPGDCDDMTEQEGELSERKREMLVRKILTAALERLPSNSTGSLDSDLKAHDTPNTKPDKKDGIQCEFCTKRTRLRGEIKRHKMRHERPCACTFQKCTKTGSKADWKRHEQLQISGTQSWQCALPDSAGQGLCTRMFSEQDVYAGHLTSQHNIDEEKVQRSICASRPGRNGEPQFWRGFCRDIVCLNGSQRVDHIDVEHFRKGERIEEWVLLSRSKDGDDNSDAESACSTSNSSNSSSQLRPIDSDISLDEVTTVDHIQQGETTSSPPLTSYTQYTNHRKRKLPTLDTYPQPYAEDTAESTVPHR